MSPSPSSPARSLDLVESPERAALLVDPLRRRLLGELRAHPDSASGLARRLRTSRQRLHYHLKALEAAGFVELAEERRTGNCVERVLRVTATQVLIDPELLGVEGADPEALQDRFSVTYLIALAARAIRELAGLRGRASRERKRLATVGIDTEVRLASPGAFDEFARDLSASIAAVVARHDNWRSPEARPFRVLAGAWPQTRRKR